MANEKDDGFSGAPGANIPDLKKKEKERKKGGAFWSGARGAAGEFGGATGGNVARAAASAASAESAALGAVEAIEGGGLWSTVARFFAGLTSTVLGQVAVGAAALLFVGAAGLVGYAVLKGDGQGVMGIPNLGGIANSMRVRSGGNDRLGVASKGEIRFDPLNPSANQPPAKAEAKPAEAAPAPVEAAPEAVDPKAASKAMQDRMAHNLSGSKLSSSLGGDFGNKNIFGGGGVNGRSGSGFNGNLAKVNMPRIGGAPGKLNAMKTAGGRMIASPRTTSKATSNRAIGQLKMAKGMSMLGAASNTSEGAATAAQGAFDQSLTNGGQLNGPGGAGIGLDPNGNVGTPSGVGAPDVSMPTAPNAPTATTTDPGLQNSLGQISQTADAGRQMIQSGTNMMLIGAVLIAAGIAIMNSTFGFGAIIGAMLIGLGGMLIGIGIMMKQMGNMMAQMAMTMGSALSAQIGNAQQGAVVNYCTNQAVTNGTAMANCAPPESITQTTAESQQNAADVNRVQQIGKDTPVIQNQP
jgi:hypothetical protein